MLVGLSYIDSEFFYIGLSDEYFPWIDQIESF